MITLNEYLLSKDNQNKIINNPSKKWSIKQILDWFEIKGITEFHPFDENIYVPDVGKLLCTYGPCYPGQNSTYWVNLVGQPEQHQGQNVLIKPLMDLSRFVNVKRRRKDISFDEAIKIANKMIEDPRLIINENEI